MIGGVKEAVNDGIKITFVKGWNEFKLPSHILMGTAHINGLDVADYTPANVLSSIAGSYDYLAYHDGTEWKVMDVTAGVDTFTVFPTGADVPAYTFSIHMTSGDTLDIETQ